MTGAVIYSSVSRGVISANSSANFSRFEGFGRVKRRAGWFDLTRQHRHVKAYQGARWSYDQTIPREIRLSGVFGIGQGGKSCRPDWRNPIICRYRSSPSREIKPSCASQGEGQSFPDSERGSQARLASFALYSECGLDQWAGKLKPLEGVRGAFAIFNNCYANFGVMNAATMAQLLAR